VDDIREIGEDLLAWSGALRGDSREQKEKGREPHARDQDLEN